MAEVTRGAAARVGVDLSKRVFQVHAVDRSGRVVLAKALSPDRFFAWCAELPAGCLVAMEACASAHHWAREMSRYGHEVRLIAPHYVKPFIKRQKNDAADAEAIVEAAFPWLEMTWLATTSGNDKIFLLTREALTRVP